MNEKIIPSATRAVKDEGKPAWDYFIFRPHTPAERAATDFDTYVAETLKYWLTSCVCDCNEKRYIVEELTAAKLWWDCYQDWVREG